MGKSVCSDKSDNSDKSGKLVCSSEWCHTFTPSIIRLKVSSRREETANDSGPPVPFIKNPESLKMTEWCLLCSDTIPSSLQILIHRMIITTL